MWFRLVVHPGKNCLSVAAMSDGKVVFKADDVGRFLGYGNSYAFARRYAPMKMTGMTSLCGRAKKQNIYCFAFDDVITVMRFGRYRYEDADGLTRLWKDGVVDSCILPTVATIPRRGKILTVVDPSVDNTFERPCRLQDWIGNYFVQWSDYIQRFRLWDDSERLVINPYCNPHKSSSSRRPPVGRRPATENYSSDVRGTEERPDENTNARHWPTPDAVRPKPEDSHDRSTPEDSKGKRILDEPNTYYPPTSNDMGTDESTSDDENFNKSIPDDLNVFVPAPVDIKPTPVDSTTDGQAFPDSRAVRDPSTDTDDRSTLELHTELTESAVINRTVERISSRCLEHVLQIDYACKILPDWIKLDINNETYTYIPENKRRRQV